jgi:hypothetical protein
MQTGSYKKIKLDGKKFMNKKIILSELWKRGKRNISHK